MPNDFHTDVVLPLLYHKLLHGVCIPKGHSPFRRHAVSILSTRLQPTYLKHFSASPTTKRKNKSIQSIPLWNNNRMTVIQYRFLRYPSVLIFSAKIQTFSKTSHKKRIAEILQPPLFANLERLLNYSSFFFKVSIMSTVILSRSYLGFQSHSARAQLSSILFGQLSAMA